MKEHTLINFTSYFIIHLFIITKLNEQSSYHPWAYLAYFKDLYFGIIAMSHLLQHWVNGVRYLLFKVARVTVAQQLSLVTLIQGTDSLCYNYSLPYTFNSVAEVAIGTY